MQPIHWIILGYLIGLAFAISWNYIEIWAHRDPREKLSKVLLVLMGWFMVPVAFSSLIMYACLNKCTKLIGKKI